MSVYVWSRETPIPPAQVVGAALALAAPTAYGVATGQVVPASFAALGALSVSPGRRSVVQWSRLGILLTSAAALGAFVGGRGWVVVMVVAGLALVAAVAGGFSRGWADAAARFLTFLVIATGFGGADVWQVARWFAIGVLWAVVLSLVQSSTPAASAPTYRQLWRRWRRHLRTFGGWQYAVRLVPPLVIALTIGVYWHQQKAYWIALAVVIVVRRRGGSLLRATQRCLGTCVGVLLGGVLVLWVPPSWLIVAVVGVLAGFRPLLKERNYTAYATIMTPLVVLLMDLGRTPVLSTVEYRLVDTVIGCLLAIIPTLMLRRRHVA